ncbi:MAG: response regulator transcription factor [bacterium]|nr:response regulator transcription factor [bacterium]
MKLLIIEDYEPLRESLKQGFEENGCAVDATGDGEEGLWLATTGQYEVIVLDLRLPGLDGLEILRRLRVAKNPVHILILTAKDSLDDRVAGLDLGADDYLVKPFEFSELLARVRALVRRSYGQKAPVMLIGDLEVDTTARTVRRAGRIIDLTAREFAIIEILARKRGRVVSREFIVEGVYDFSAELGSNVIDVYIGRLRRKLGKTGETDLIRTVRGFGYVMGEES